MKTIARLLLAVVLLVPSVSVAEGVGRSPRSVMLNAVAANAAEASRTFVLVSSGGTSSKTFTGGYNLAVLHVNMNYTDGTTAVGLVCSVSDDGGTNKYVMQSCDVSSGACTSSDASWSKAIAAADKKFGWRVDITGYSYVSCVATCTGGTANETISISGYLTTK
jgi:hypothetical protein